MFIFRQVNQLGMTLFEILIALFIFTLISVLLTSTLHEVINNMNHTTEKAGHLRQLQKALLLISRDIELVGHHPWLMGLQFHPEHFYDSSTPQYPDQNAALFKDYLDSVRIVKQQKAYKQKLLEEITEPSSTILKKTSIKQSDLHKLVHQFIEESKMLRDTKETRALLKEKIRSVASAKYFVEKISTDDISQYNDLFENAIGKNTRKLILFLEFLPISQRLNVLTHFQSIVTNGIELYEILILFPHTKRLEVAMHFQSIIGNSKERNAILSLLPQEKRWSFFEITEPKSKEFEDLISLLSMFPNHAEQLIDDYVKNKKINPYATDIKYNELSLDPAGLDINIIRTVTYSGLDPNTFSILNKKLKLIENAEDFTDFLNAMPVERYSTFSTLFTPETFKELIQDDLEEVLKKLTTHVVFFIQSFRLQLTFSYPASELFVIVSPYLKFPSEISLVKELLQNKFIETVGGNTLIDLLKNQPDTKRWSILTGCGKDLVPMIQNIEQLKSILNLISSDHYTDLAILFWQNAAHQSTVKFLEVMPILAPYLPQDALENIKEIGDYPNWSREKVAQLYQAMSKHTEGENKTTLLKNYADYIKDKNELEAALINLNTEEAGILFYLTKERLKLTTQEVKAFSDTINKTSKTIIYKIQENFVRSLLKKHEVDWSEIGKNLKIISKDDRPAFIKECALKIDDKKQLASFLNYLNKAEIIILLENLNKNKLKTFLINESDFYDVIKDLEIEKIPWVSQTLFNLDLNSKDQKGFLQKKKALLPVRYQLELQFLCKILMNEMRKAYQDKGTRKIEQIESISRWLSTQSGINAQRHDFLLILLKELCYQEEHIGLFNKTRSIKVFDQVSNEYKLSSGKNLSDIKIKLFDKADIEQLTKENYNLVPYLLEQAKTKQAHIAKP